MEKLTLGVLIFLTCAWALRELYNTKDKKLERNTDVTVQNTIAVMELKVELGHVKAALLTLPKIQADVNEAHSKIREINVAIKSHKNH